MQIIIIIIITIYSCIVYCSPGIGSGTRSVHTCGVGSGVGCRSGGGERGFT